MKRTLQGLAMFLATTAALAWPVAAAERWLHIKVDEAGGKSERVRVNLPLELAEKVLPAIQTDKLHDGKIKVDEPKLKTLDLRALLEAVRTTKDNEFITVESDLNKVRVAKVGGNLVIRVREGKDQSKKVDVTLPFPVAEALLSGGRDELDILAAVRALTALGDVELVTVNDKSSSVRIWVDSRNTSE